MHTRAPLLLAVLLGACGPAGPIHLRAAEYDPLTRALTPIRDGDPLHLQLPPQGGVVLFIGGRIEGSLGSLIELGARLSIAGTLIGEDRRTSKLVPAADEAGVWMPALDNFAAFANVPVCPTGGVTGTFADAILEVTVTEPGSGRADSARLSVGPRCLQGDAGALALCTCQCAADYQPGHCP